ncbi:sigma-54 dependent transcriptional regulator [Myxococcota bacterium]|nr:sigma-54 dependent transcriptional regulator [Myxococcota bacterium]
MARRVLVADDEENIRYMLELTLRREGYDVRTVPDGEAALQAITTGDFDVVLCDLVMPKMTGLELLDALRARGLSVNVILMSAHADVETALSAVARGAFDYLPKPARTDEVLFRLRRAIEQATLRAEVGRLKAALEGAPTLGRIVAESKPMLQVFTLVRKVADFKTTVLLTGESGTGKELVARAIHDSSGRAKAPFVAINCGAIPENLLESELFGHVRGAFTDATRTRRGLFEEADGGTLFLDEIGELPLNLQVKLLRVLQEEEIRKVGDTKAQKVDVRVVAATVRDLGEEVKAGRFREDLYYRLNVLSIRLPPLRERRTDIPLLALHFVRQFNDRLGTAVRGVTPAAMRALIHYAWPGNVRELENTIERALVLVEGDEIGEDDLSPRIRDSQDRIKGTLAAGELSIKKTTRVIEEELIRRALAKTGGNRTRAAEILELSHRALLYKIKEYGIEA